MAVGLQREPLAHRDEETGRDLDTPAAPAAIEGIIHGEQRVRVAGQRHIVRGGEQEVFAVVRAGGAGRHQGEQSHDKRCGHGPGSPGGGAAPAHPVTAARDRSVVLPSDH